jgi:hypothetical protein
MTTKEVANRFYELAQQGNWDKIQEELFSKEAASIEPAHTQGLQSVTGIDNIKQKGVEWNAMIDEMHGGYCNAPQVAGNYFTCTMGADVTMKGQGRINMEEVALYEVQNGKIVKEQFFY